MLLRPPLYWRLYPKVTKQLTWPAASLTLQSQFGEGGR